MVNLNTKLSEIKGVGPKTFADFSRAGLETAGDLINFLPRNYEDFSRTEKISQLKPGKVTIRARAESVTTRYVRRGMRITNAVLVDDFGDKIQAVWFNQAYRETQMKSGAEFYFSGDFGLKGNRYQLSNPSCEKVTEFAAQNNIKSESNETKTAKIVPIYPKRAGLKPSLTRKILAELKPLITMLPENLPPEIVARENLLSHAEALRETHFPSDKNKSDLARERLAFEELFSLILAARLNKNENSQLNGFNISFNLAEFREVLESLPFKLTDAQRKAIWEILKNIGANDSQKISPMNRLLQGDVGSGKTAVAGLVAFVVARAGFQTAFMAPTEILATQHAKTLDNLLSPFGVKVALLTGSVKGKNRAELLEKIANGEAQVIVGTHALFQPNVKFADLAFAVIDEQHRFGVKQRHELLAKSRDKFLPHLLAMTATPIPRSLQLTVFGDLDISILNELPKGRQPIATEIISPNSRAQMNDKIRAELENGRQIYFIAPNIEKTEKSKSEKENVADLFKKVAKDFKGFQIGVLHGKMPAESKEKVMRDFAEFSADSREKPQILVATTVVEVGVDVPNASIIIIENADQFGLSQLHQLRGRVGRGKYQSHCFLMMSNSAAPTRRLREIEKSNDGFYLSEVDLELRGAGEIYGTAQHGALNLQIANLADTKLIKRASLAANYFAKEIIQNPEILIKYKELTKEVNKYQQLTTLN